MSLSNEPTHEDLRRAAKRIAPYVHRTPVMTCTQINTMAGAELFFKCENLQRVGAFKIRGATNAILSLSADEAARGVITHSSGNHAAAVACAAKIQGIKATVVMPENAVRCKRRAVEFYGARVIYCSPTPLAREQEMQAVMERTGAVQIHPYNDSRIIAGQSTTAIELYEQVNNLDAIVSPVGGGGLLSGAALGTEYKSPDTAVFGAEPENVDDAYRSLKSSAIQPPTGAFSIADGLLTSLGDLTFTIMKKHVLDIVTVGEIEIVAAMRLIWERMKQIVEPSAAVALAAVLCHRQEFAAQRIGIILTGGNVDLDDLPWMNHQNR